MIKLLRKIVITIPVIVMIIYIEAFGILLYKLGYLKSTIIKDYILGFI